MRTKLMRKKRIIRYIQKHEDVIIGVLLVAMIILIAINISISGTRAVNHCIEEGQTEQVCMELIK